MINDDKLTELDRTVTDLRKQIQAETSARIADKADNDRQIAKLTAELIVLRETIERRSDIPNI